MSIEEKDITNFYSNDSTKLQDFNFAMLSTPKKDEPVDGIEIIMNMAKSGKLDPWNIDLTDLADKYLVEFAKLKTINLKYTGRTILFLSVLLKMKSNILAGVDYNQFAPVEEQVEYIEEDDDFHAEYEDENRNNVISINSIDEAMERSTAIRMNRKRVVTLQDLIEQLKFYEKLEKKAELKSQLKQREKRFRSYAPQKVLELAQDDYILKVLPEMRANLDMIFKNETKIELETLTLLGFSKMTAYIALLYLTPQTDYTLTQEKFYDKLYIEKTKEQV